MSEQGERCCISHPDYMDVPSESTNCVRGVVTYYPHFTFPTQHLLAQAKKWRDLMCDIDCGDPECIAWEQCAIDIEALL